MSLVTKKSLKVSLKSIQPYKEHIKEIKSIVVCEKPQKIAWTNKQIKQEVYNGISYLTFIDFNY